MSTVEPTTSEASQREAAVSHLLSTDELLYPSWGGIRITLCGEDVRVGDAGVIPGEHCPGCDCAPRFCPECVREACQWSADARG